MSESKKKPKNASPQIDENAVFKHPFQLYRECHGELDFQDALSEWREMTAQQKSRYYDEYEAQLKPSDHSQTSSHADERSESNKAAKRSNPYAEKLKAVKKPIAKASS